MAKTVRSARGTVVDFDLINIKNTMAAVPLNDNAKKRERFINKKRRRGMKRKVDEMAQAKKLETANFQAVVSDMGIKVPEPVLETKVIEPEDPNVEKKSKRKVGGP